MSDNQETDLYLRLHTAIADQTMAVAGLEALEKELIELDLLIQQKKNKCYGTNK